MAQQRHPFDPLSPEEIVKTTNIVRDHLPGQDVNFRFITLREPLKKDMVAFLQGEPSCPSRCARVQVVASSKHSSNKLVEMIVDVEQGLVSRQEYLDGKHPHIDPAYMQAAEKACMADSNVQMEIKRLMLPSNATVCVESWTYATDGMNDMSLRVTMCWFYMRLLDHPDANYYAYPLDLCAEVSDDLKVSRVYHLPSSENERIHDTARPYDQRKIHLTSQSEYHPDLRPLPRTSTRPYQVVQPEGPSFQIEGNQISWENWHLHVGFNYREGLTLHNIQYEGRSLFYRLSLAEMFVPYGDPRSPFTRKAAFDLGNDGAGLTANNLRLGCDCLGTIAYFDGWHNTSKGEPLRLPNVVCCHEQDDGILWKHSNYRTQNPVVTRSRILVLQTIITVSNYEYIFAFHFGQDASIHYEVRATGILSTCPINLGDAVPYGLVVAPGVMAPYHQHLFSMRIDPAIDGHTNSLLVEESVPLPIDDPKIHNPFGVGYVTKTTFVDEEQGLDLDFTKNRTFKIVNEQELNKITGTPVGFKLVPHYSQMLLAHPSSYHAKRSEFANHAVWVTRYDDEETFPSGRYTMQSMGGGGIASAIAARRDDPTVETSVRDADIVVWHTFGSTHNPRIEDWPVMPSEKMTVGLKPVNFFTKNPSLDVAVSTQEQNKSMLLNPASCTNGFGTCHSTQ